MTRIKICGITTEADALAAAEAGADALGFVFAESPRRISWDTALQIIRRLPPFIASVGVFVNSSEDEVYEAIQYLNLDYVQLHGRETPDFCARFSTRAIKALLIDETFDFKQAAAFQKTTRALLVDSGGGGTGRTFDWNVLPPDFERSRLILAGGLNPDNIIQAIKTVNPWAVDVSSGVESMPGRKDRTKIIQFINKVKGANYETI